MGEEVLYSERNIKQIKQVKAMLKTIAEKIAADPSTNGLATVDVTINAVAELCQIFAHDKGERP